jgi:nucleotide-binding universal stress UspA family protein
VVGVDGTIHSGPAVAFAFEEAAVRAVPLTAIHIWAEPPRTGDDELKPTGYERDEAEHEAARTLADALAGYREKYPDVDVTSELVCSIYTAETLLYRSESADLIVVGTRGRGRTSGAVLGSVGQKLIHRAHCPVAIVPTIPNSHD